MWEIKRKAFLYSVYESTPDLPRSFEGMINQAIKTINEIGCDNIISISETLLNSNGSTMVVVWYKEEDQNSIDEKHNLLIKRLQKLLEKD